MENKYNVNYDCGCVHEIERDTSKGVFLFQPTGNNQNCSEHNGS